MLHKISGDKVIGFAVKISNNVYLKAMQSALGLAFPLIIFGSLLLIIMKFPYFPTDITLMLERYLTKPVASLMYISLFTAFGMGYYLHNSLTNQSDIGKGVKVGVTSIVALLILTPFNEANGMMSNNVELPLGILHTHSLMLSFIVGIMTTHLYLWLDTIKIPIETPKDLPPAVVGSFTSLLPITIILSIFTVFGIAGQFLPINSFNEWIYSTIQEPIIQVGGSFLLTILALLLVQIFWFIGMHGSQMVYPLFDGIWLHNSYDNSLAFLMNQPLEHIVTKQFIEVFSVGVGSMGTLSAGLAVLLISRSREAKQVAKMGLPSALFNISEPLSYGLPIILNPIFLVPWLVGAPLVGAMAYLSMAWGWVPYTTGVNVPWTTPFIISGFFATNSWQGALLQLIQFIVLLLLWIPFILIDNRVRNKKS